MHRVDLPPLIEQMTRAAFYPHPVAGDRVRIIQTHISYLLLTGEYAYKVKKPVNFGFVDFRTLEQRRHFCNEELRLNRRGAAELYVDVVSITEPGSGRFRLGGEGRPVEFAVRMREFPQAALLSEQLSLGRVSEEDIESLAEAVAKYHAAVPPAPASFGEPEAVRCSIDDNYEGTDRYTMPGGPQTPEQLMRTHEFTTRFVADQHELLRRRAHDGHIRECHGDLHLGNICRAKASGGAFLLFDCIEFNDAFRHVDVMYDIAFTAMDLRARKRPDLANAFVNRYAELTGDWDGLRVLPLYLCRQAYVRAKVRSLLLDEPETSDVERRAAFDEAARYYRLAREYTLPRDARLVVMCGRSGSGKTTVARRLARVLDAAHVRSDAVRKHLAGIAPTDRGDATIYSAEMTDRTYRRLNETGAALIVAGYPVILDATHLTRDSRVAALAMARGASARVTIVYCVAPDDVLRARLETRRADIADATAGVLKLQAATMQSFTAAETVAVVTVDTTKPLEPQLRPISAS
jgi:hypothetical protein